MGGTISYLENSTYNLVNEILNSITKTSDFSDKKVRADRDNITNSETIKEINKNEINKEQNKLKIRLLQVQIMKYNIHTSWISF